VDNLQLPAQSINASPTDLLLQETIGCRVRSTQLGTSRGFDKSTKAIVANAIGVKDNASVSGQIRLYDQDYPLVKQHNKLFGDVVKFHHSYTVPLASSKLDTVEGGVRLIRRSHADQFHMRMLEFRSELRGLVDKFNAEREDILRAASLKLGAKFHRDNYPDVFEFGVTWSFPSVHVPTYLADLAPQAAAHQLEQVRQQMTATLGAAAADILEELLATVQNWATRLGPVTRLRPAKSHEWYDAEVVGRRIVDGKTILTLSVKGKEVVTEPLTAEAVAALHETRIDSERRIIRTSTADNLMDAVSRFNLFADTLSVPQSTKELVQRIETFLAPYRGSANELADTLRNSASVRSHAHQMMAALDSQLVNAIETINTSVGRRAIRMADPAAA
jgi:hypothetical protein